MAENESILSRIDYPRDLRRLSPAELEALAAELREFIVATVAETGGHLASSLGAVELTLALHYVLDTPGDRLIWDVGHQCYPHKIITGRRDAMAQLRRRGGPAGFPLRGESVYDAFGTGHSSTSISAALGMALAARGRGETNRHVAVIGDGAMTAGMAFEALNHAGGLKADLLVVLNDNEMSISPNVGAMNKALARMLSGRLFSTVREGSKRILDYIPPMRELARRTEEHVKGMIVPGTFFEELDFSYYGPIDGHDLGGLIQVLGNIIELEGPRLLHVVTRKGKGYQPAERDPCSWHGVARFDPQAGAVRSTAAAGPAYTGIFGRWLCDMADNDPRLAAVTPAMREGSGMVDFSERFPDRFFDVGIAEQHAVTFAAGLACEGMRPVVAIYSTFLQRAYDQLIHDVALQNLPVLFAVDRGGIVGPDGPTHSGSFDLSFMRCIPNMVVMAPADEQECRDMLYTGYRHEGPAAVRYPRGCGPGAAVTEAMTLLPLGKGEVVRAGKGVAILAFGAPLAAAREAGERLDATVANMRFIKPLDDELVLSLAAGHELLVTVEDNAVAGGAGSAVNELLARAGVTLPVVNLGLPDRFQEHGSRDELLAEAGVDTDAIVREVAVRTGRMKSVSAPPQQ